MIRRQSLHAVHEMDLENFLKSLGILEAITQGRLRCAVCGDTISLETFQCAFPDRGQIKVACHRPECFAEAIKQQESK